MPTQRKVIMEASIKPRIGCTRVLPPPQRAYKINGKTVHARTIQQKKPKHLRESEFIALKYRNAERIIQEGKHKYLMPLDRKMRKQVAPLAKPYPKRDTNA